MKLVRRFSTVLTTSLWACTAMATNAVERIYAEVLFPNPQQQDAVWRPLDRSQLPKPFDDPTSPMAESAFYSGFALVGTRTVVVFEFLHPALVGGTEYCRSTVSLYQYYDYDSNIDYSDLPRSVIIGFAELVDFDASLRSDSKQCSYGQLEDLDEFVIFGVQTTAPLLTQIWQIFQSIRSAPSDADCRVSEVAVLETVGLVPRFNQHVDDYYSLIIADEGLGSSVVELAPTEQGLIVEECGHGLLD